MKKTRGHQAFINFRNNETKFRYGNVTNSHSLPNFPASILELESLQLSPTLLGSRPCLSGRSFREKNQEQSAIPVFFTY